MSDGQKAVWFALGEMLLQIEALPVPERVQVISDLADYFVALQGDLIKEG